MKVLDGHHFYNTHGRWPLKCSSILSGHSFSISYLENLARSTSLLHPSLLLLHQVLHFAQDPGVALAEAARVTRAGGRIAIVDFASHDHEELRTRHQHVRLGFTDRQMADLLKTAGFAANPPTALEGGEIVVKIWTAKRRAAASPKTAALESTP